jgi:hypothetical protein
VKIFSVLILCPLRLEKIEPKRAQSYAEEQRQRDSLPGETL